MITTEAKNVPKLNASAVTATVNPRCRNTRRSTIGLPAVSSQIRKVTKPIAAMIAQPTMKLDPSQSCSRPRSSMICSAAIHTTIRNRPKRSIGTISVLVSDLRNSVKTPTMQKIAIGRLM